MSAPPTSDPTSAPVEAVEVVGREQALDLLPDPLRTVVRTGHAKVASALGDTHGGVLGDLSRFYELIDTFPRAGALRRLVRTECATLLTPSPDPDPDQGPGQALGWARALLDDQGSLAAAGEIKVFLREQNKARSAQRRAQRRESRPSAEERAEARTEDRIQELRQDRDTARNRVSAAEEISQGLRTQLEQADEARRDAEGSYQSALHQIGALRARFADPVHLAGLLAGQLRAATHDSDSQHPAESPTSGSRHRDPFAVLDKVPVQPPESTPAPDTSDGGDTGDVSDSGDSGGFGADRSTLGREQRGLLAALLATVASPPATYTQDLSLRVEVLGAGAEIGGSCVLVQAAGTRVLVDCGIRPRGKDATSMAPPGYTRDLARTVDAVVITHAHNDHAGWVPALLADNPGIAIYATQATCDLLITMWRDSAKVMARTGARCYNQSDVNRALDAFSETPLRQVIRVGELTIELFAAGHIVGAAGVVVSAGSERVVISGDVSGPGQETVGGFSPTGAAHGADLMLLESTYADDRHLTPRAAAVADLVRTVERVVDRNGIALVPAFALGRAQEVALLLRRHLPGVPVLIDGLAREVTEVYERHAGAHLSAHSGTHAAPGAHPGRRDIYSEKIRAVPVGGTERATRTFTGGVVITTSGMLNQGPAVPWAKRVLPDPNSALLVVGYQDEESPGARLLRLADAGGGQFELPGRDGAIADLVEVYADVGRYQLGAHANADELAGIVTSTRPQQLMLVHGEQRAQERFRLRMNTRAQSTVAAGIWTP